MIGFTKIDLKEITAVLKDISSELAQHNGVQERTNQLLQTNAKKLEEIKKSNDEFISTITHFFGIDAKRKIDEEKRRKEREDEMRPTEADSRY